MIRVLPDAERLAAGAAERVARAATASLEARGRFRLALSGGTTPQRLYGIMAEPEHRASLAAASIEILFADERGVPPRDPDSNYGMVKRVLLDPAGIPAERVRRMRGELDDLDRAARDYEPFLAEPIDLLILGIGEDGHTASLFPGSTALSERMRRVVAIEGPKPPPRRMTITPRVVAEARVVMMLASGDSKAHAVSMALEGEPDAVPAALARAGEWWMDAAAAGLLKAVPRTT